MPRKLPETIAAWVPTDQMWEVIDLLATGYSQQAISRALDVNVQTINSWLHAREFSEQFREMVAKRTEEFHTAKDAVHDQQVIMALQIIQDALTGELQRERVGDSAVTPLRYEAAIQLLRGTFWAQKRGGHKAFGAS